MACSVKVFAFSERLARCRGAGIGSAHRQSSKGARKAREEESPTFVTHVRYASEGGVRLENSHPFELDGRVFAHNRHLGRLDKLDPRLGEDRVRLTGDTDSEPHPLLMLDRAIGGPTGQRHLDAASAAGTIRVRSSALADRRAVIFASERMDEDSGWRELESGELVHIDSELEVSSRVLLDRPPAHRLRIEDLEPLAAASQRDPRDSQPVGRRRSRLQ